MKRFNNFRRMLLPVAAQAAAIGLTLGGCTKVDDTLGGNLIPDNQQMRAGYVQLPRADELNPKKYVETRLFQTDSIVSSNITYGYMGSMLNDTLGHRSAGFLSQMVNYYKVDSGYFGYMPIFDSAQILLKVTSFGRDSVTEQSFAVYEVVSNKYLTEKPIAPNKSQRDSTFYLNFDPVAEGVYNPDEPLFTFTLGGEGKYPSTTSAVTLEPTEAGKKYIRRLMLQEGEYAGDYSIYSADSLKYWVEAFKGLYIAPNPEKPLTEYGKGTIFATELTYSGLSVYGRNRVKDDPSLIKDTIGMVYYFYKDGAEFGSVSVNNVKHDYEEATIARRINIEEARETAENRPENPLVYVEGMGGVVTEMTFSPEFFAELEAEIAKGNADGKNFKTLAFSQVRMSIYFNDSDYEWDEDRGRNGRRHPAHDRPDERIPDAAGHVHQLQDADADFGLRLRLRAELRFFGNARLQRQDQPQPRLLRNGHHGLHAAALEQLHGSQGGCGRRGCEHRLGQSQEPLGIHRTRSVQPLHDLVRRVAGHADTGRDCRTEQRPDPFQYGVQPDQVNNR